MPRTMTTTKTVYKLSELTGTARETALAKLAEWATDDSFWYESVIEDAKTIGALMGIEIEDVFFSGFSSQGDGACFTGTYSWRKGCVQLVKEYAPQDKTLHLIVHALQKIQAPNFYRLTANVTHHGHYSHEYCTSIEVDGELVADAEDALKDALRDYMRWIYRQLEAEYEYRTSEEALLEDAEANDWEFTEDGRIA